MASYAAIELFNRLKEVQLQASCVLEFVSHVSKWLVW